MADVPPIISGGCACGRIRYEISTAPDGASNCYCAQCRKISGGPFLTFGHFPTASITWNQQPDLWRFSNVAERGFCLKCGSALTMQYDLQPGRISVAYGSIDESKVSLSGPMDHIFLKEKAAWYQIPDDGGEKYEEFDPPFQKKLDAWKKSKVEI